MHISASAGISYPRQSGGDTGLHLVTNAFPLVTQRLDFSAAFPDDNSYWIFEENFALNRFTNKSGGADLQSPVYAFGSRTYGFYRDSSRRQVTWSWGAVVDVSTRWRLQTTNAVKVQYGYSAGPTAVLDIRPIDDAWIVPSRIALRLSAPLTGAAYKSPIGFFVESIMEWPITWFSKDEWLSLLWQTEYAYNKWIFEPKTLTQTANTWIGIAFHF